MSGEVKAGAAPPAPPPGWYLETVSEGGTLRRVKIRTLPFRVGRRQGLELVLPAESVSKVHAELYTRGQDLRLRDLGSRNGCFVNRALVEDAALVEGDIVHFADFEFRRRPNDAALSSSIDLAILVELAVYLSIAGYLFLTVARRTEVT